MALKALRDSDRCPTCGKWRSVMNVATRGFRPEHISSATHCLCEGSPVLGDYQRQQERAR